MRAKISISGWHYTLDVTPKFTLDSESGTIRSTSASSFGVSRHNITVTAGSYSSTVEVTIVVIRDSDGDGIADTEDYDDDDDHLDSLDNCPLDFGTSTSGGYIGCPDGDGDGWADLIDPFSEDDTQWKDTDGDGYGDNPLGNNCDEWILDASQWFDTDADGFGDNEFGTRRLCPTVQGNSTLDIFGCPDSDGDGWSDEGDSFPLIGSHCNRMETVGVTISRRVLSKSMLSHQTALNGWMQMGMVMVTTNTVQRVIGSLKIQPLGRLRP